jgi:O-antigen/teichoic acid export membrane protein
VVGETPELAAVMVMTSNDLAPRESPQRATADLSGLARRSTMSLAGAVVSAIANLLVIVVVARGAGRSEAGLLFAATSVFIIAQSICGLGTATGVVYFVSRCRALGRPEDVRVILRRALVAVASLSVVASIALLAAAPSIAGLFLSRTQLSLDGATFIRLLVVFLPCAVVYDTLTAASQGFHTMKPTVVLEKIGRPLTQIALLGCAVLSGVGWLLPLAWAAPYALTLALMMSAVRRLVSQRSAALPVAADRSTTDGFWRYTAPRGLAAAGQLVLQRLDIILVAGYLGAGEAAIYTAATRFVALGQLGSQAVALAVQPKLSELLAIGDRRSVQQVYQTSTSWVVATTRPIHLLVGLLAPVVLFVFGHGYDEGSWVVVILAGSMLVATGCGMVTTVLVMAGRTRWNLLNVAIALVSNVVLNVLLIPRMGITGAAVAWGVAIVLSNVIPLAQVRRLLGIHPFGPATVQAMGLAIVALLPLPLAVWLFAGQAAYLLVPAAAVGAFAYAVGLWLLRSRLGLDAVIAPLGRRRRAAA